MSREVEMACINDVIVRLLTVLFYNIVTTKIHLGTKTEVIGIEHKTISYKNGAIDNLGAFVTRDMRQWLLFMQAN